MRSRDESTGVAWPITAMVSSRLVSDASRVLADQARAAIVVQRLEERCIDREARAAGVEHQPEYAVAIVELVPPSKHAMGKSRSGLPQ